MIDSSINQLSLFDLAVKQVFCLRVDSELDATSRCVDHYTSQCSFSLFWVKFLRQRLQNALSAIRYRCKHNVIEVIILIQHLISRFQLYVT